MAHGLNTSTNMAKGQNFSDAMSEAFKGTTDQLAKSAKAFEDGNKKANKSYQDWKDKLDKQKEREYQIDKYKELHDGELPDESLTTDEISAANTTKENEKATLQGPDPEAAKYAAAFNDYVRLTGKKPFSGWNLEQLETELNNEKY